MGEVIKGTFDFSQGTISCYQLSVRLQTEQTIISTTATPTRGKKPVLKTIAEHHELTKNTMHTSFTFYIPTEAVPEVSTELGNGELREGLVSNDEFIVSIRWLLQFEFITSTSLRNLEGSELAAEPLHWSYPIKVLTVQLPPHNMYKQKPLVIV